MSTLLKTAIAAATILALVPAILIGCAHKRRPVVIYSGEWAPYVTRFDNGHPAATPGVYGEMAEVVATVVRAMHLDPSIELVAWGDIEAHIPEPGTWPILAAFPFGKAQKRKKEEWAFSKSVLGVSRERVFVNDDHHPASELTAGDFAHWKLGWLPGYSLTDSISALFPEAKNPALPKGLDEVDAIRMLILGEIDAFLCDEFVVRHILFESFPEAFDRVRPIPDLMEERELFLIAPVRHQSFLTKFDEAFASATPSLKRIHRRYARSKTVILRGYPGQPLVVGRLAIQDERPSSDAATLAIPHGTRAIVLAWGEHFTRGAGQAGEPLDEGVSRVLIRNGPLEGQEIWVRAPFIHLESK